MRVALALCTVLVSWTAVASAQSEEPPSSYRGVAPGKSGQLAPANKRAAVYWLGFQKQEGGAARVFVQLGTTMDYEQWLEDSALIVHLEGAQLGNRHAGRRLDMRFFGTRLASAEARVVRRRVARGNRRAHGPGVQISIRFRNAQDVAEASAILRSADDGFSYLTLDFAPGSGAAGDAETPTVKETEEESEPDDT